MAETTAPWRIEDTHNPAAAGPLEVRWVDLSTRVLIAATDAADLATGTVTIALANVTADAPGNQDREYYWANRAVYFEAPAAATSQVVTITGTWNGASKSVSRPVRVDGSTTALTNFGAFDTVTGASSDGSIVEDGCRIISGMVMCDNYRAIRLPSGGSIAAAFYLTRPSSGGPADNHGTLPSLPAGSELMGITELSAAPTDAEIWL